MYHEAFTRDERVTIESMKAIDMFKVDGKRDPSMRQRTRDGQGFIRMTHGSPQSQYLKELCGVFTAHVLATLDEIVANNKATSLDEPTVKAQLRA